MFITLKCVCYILPGTLPHVGCGWIRGHLGAAHGENMGFFGWYIDNYIYIYRIIDTQFDDLLIHSIYTLVNRILDFLKDAQFRLLNHRRLQMLHNLLPPSLSHGPMVGSRNFHHSPDEWSCWTFEKDECLGIVLFQLMIIDHFRNDFHLWSTI